MSFLCSFGPLCQIVILHVFLLNDSKASVSKTQAKQSTSSEHQTKKRNGHVFCCLKTKNLEGSLFQFYPYILPVCSLTEPESRITNTPNWHFDAVRKANKRPRVFISSRHSKGQGISQPDYNTQFESGFTHTYRYTDIHYGDCTKRASHWASSCRALKKRGNSWNQIDKWNSLLRETPVAKPFPCGREVALNEGQA